jgi:hypothetical protein
MECMSTLTDQFTEFTTRTQDAVTGAVRTWADTVTSLTGGQPKLPGAHVAADRYFDLAQQMLDGQRAVVRTVLDAGGKAAETVAEQAARTAETVTGHAVNVTETVTSKAAGAAKAASRRAAGATES